MWNEREMMDEVEDFFFERDDIKIEAVQFDGDNPIIRMTFIDGKFFEVWQEKNKFIIGSESRNFGGFEFIGQALSVVK